MINHEHKFIFLHIPKCAGVSIGSTLNKLVGISDPYEGFSIHHDFISRKTLEEYFVFTFVRNPWDRMVSQYKYRHFLHSKYTFNYVTKNIQELYEEHYNVKSDGIQINMDPITYYGELIHLPSQLEFLRGKFGDFDKTPFIDFIGRYENLQEDFDEVCSKIGLDYIKLPHKNKGEGSACNDGSCKSIRRKNYREFYDEETKDFVALKYKEEIEKFKYSYE